MKCKLNPRLSASDWNEFCERFHFPMTDVPYIKAIYMAMLPLIDAYVRKGVSKLKLLTCRAKR